MSLSSSDTDYAVCAYSFYSRPTNRSWMRHRISLLHGSCCSQFTLQVWHSAGKLRSVPCNCWREEADATADYCYRGIDRPGFLSGAFPAQNINYSFAFDERAGAEHVPGHRRGTAGVDVFQSVNVLASGRGGFWDAMNVVASVNPVGRVARITGKAFRWSRIARGGTKDPGDRPSKSIEARTSRFGSQNRLAAAGAGYFHRPGSRKPTLKPNAHAE